MADIFNLSDTWNDGATTFSAIKMSVTDTASASGSLLMDLQVGGSSKFNVRKSGFASFIGSTVNDKVDISVGTNEASVSLTTNSLGQKVYLTAADTTNSPTGGNSGLIVSSTSHVAWSLNANMNSGISADLFLRRDAANTLAQRRTTTTQSWPQAYRIYGSYTDASNYERGKIAWESNVLKIGTEKAGTGSARALELQTDGVTRVTIPADSGNITTSGFLSAATTGYGFNGFNGTTRGMDVSGSTLRLNTSAGAIIQFGDNNGVVGLQVVASAGPLIRIGGITDAFPALKRSTTSLQARLADDSDFTNVQGKITTETAYTAGAPTATGYIVLYDSTGTAYKVPAEAL